MTSSGINTRVSPSGTGCADCDAACAQCGHIGCCDTSPAQHATAHARATGHRYIQSFEPGEDWYYDYETQDMLEGPRLVAPVAHPDDQPAPGPSGRVPSDWMRRIHS